MSLRLGIIAIAAVLVIGLAGSLWLQSHRLGITHRLLDDTRERLEATTRAMNELAALHAAELQRKTLTETASEAIRRAPEGDNSGIAPVLLQGLKSADQVGGY